MERHEILDAMSELRLYGMRASSGNSPRGIMNIAGCRSRQGQLSIGETDGKGFLSLPVIVCGD